MQGKQPSDTVGNDGAGTHGHTPALAIGDRVWLLLRSLPRRPEVRHDGTVIGIDDGPIPGVRIALDQPALTPDCYASHREVRRR